MSSEPPITKSTDNSVAFRYQLLLVFLLTAAAIFTRLSIIHSTYDFPGDAISRALASYEWSLHPKWISSAYWAPGFTYINGSIMMLLKNPYVTTRIVNAVLGGLSVAVLFFTAKKIFGFFAAVCAASTLVLMPLDVGLSASGLTEAPFISYILLSFFALIQAATVAPEQKNKRIFWLSISCFMMIIANMIRCESWTYLPLWLGYYFLRTRRAIETTAVAMVLAIFPLSWLWSCWQDYNMPFLSFSTASDPRNNFISVPEAISAVSYMLLQFLGPILLIGAIFGAVQLLRSGKDKLSELNPERLFYLSWTALLLVTAVALAANYGANMQARFLLLLMVLLMPIGGYALTKLPYFAAKIASGKKASFMVALVLASLFSIESSLITCWLIKPDIFITTMKTAELDALSDWLKKTHNDDKTIVFTSINYRAFQVPLQCPKLVGRSNIVMDFWTPLLDLRDELKAQPPNFLVTGDDDGKDLAALTSVADFSIAKPAIFENGFVHAYKIIPGTFACKPDPKMPACFWYPTPNWRTLFQSWKRKTTQNHSTSS